MLHGLSGCDDPGLPARLLRVSNAISGTRGQRPWQRPRQVVIAETMAWALVAVVVYGLLLALP